MKSVMVATTDGEWRTPSPITMSHVLSWYQTLPVKKWNNSVIWIRCCTKSLSHRRDRTAIPAKLGSIESSLLRNGDNTIENCWTNFDNDCIACAERTELLPCLGFWLWRAPRDCSMKDDRRFDFWGGQWWKIFVRIQFMQKNYNFI